MIKSKKKKKQKYIKIQLPPKIDDEPMSSKLAWKTDPWA